MSNANNVIDVSEENFDTEVVMRSYEIPVLVDFWAPWCGPCRSLSPILEKLAADPVYEFVLAKVNVDENPGLSMQYQVQGIPAVKAFWEGELIDEFVGALPEGRVRQFIEKISRSEVDYALSDVNSLLATRHWEEAEAVCREILLSYPGNQPTTLRLAVALLAQGRGREATDYLRGLQDGAELLRAQRLRPLADLLSLAEDEEGDSVDGPDAQFVQAGRLIQQGKYEAGMDGLIDILRQDKRYRKGAARDVMLAVFDLLGENDDLTVSYRNELASVLF